MSFIEDLGVHGPGFVKSQLVANGIGTRAVMLESVTFGSLPNGWVNGGNSWVFDGARAVSGGNGHTFQLKTSKPYGLQRRVIRWEFAMTTAGAKAIFCFNPIENPANKGAAIRVNSGNAPSIDILRGYDGTVGSNVLASYSGAPYFLDASPNIYTNGSGLAVYIAEIIKDGRSFTFNLYAKSGRLIASVSRIPSAFGYTAYPAWGYDQGLVTGAPGFYMDVGSGFPIRFDHWAICAQNPHLYILSDSTDEGLCVMDHQRPGDLISARIGAENIAISACGGATATSAIARAQAELPLLKPKYMLYKLGTNADASFNASTNAIIDLAKSLGTQVVVCNTAAQYVQSVFLSGLSLPLVDLASVLTVSGAGSPRPDVYYGGYDAAGTFYNDGLHPNNIGNQAIFDKIRLDAPYLVDVPPGPNSAGTSKSHYRPVNQKTLGPYTATVADDTIPVDASLRACPVWLPPAASCIGKELRIGKVDSSANAVTPTAVGNDKINGTLSSISITNPWQYKTLKSDGYGWVVVASS